MQPIIAFTPILACIVYLVFLKWKAKKALTVALLITLAIAFFIWKIPIVYLSASIIEGISIAIAILWIVFGAILLLNVLNYTNAFEVIKHTFIKIHSDKYVQLIIIAWFFGAFMEGISGFGTPAAICAPLLIAVGFKPLESVVLSLIANSVPVTFGAVGTPVLIGIKKGLSTVVNSESLDVMVIGISEFTAMLNIFSGSFVPLILVLFYARFFDSTKSWKLGLAYWKIALFSGFSFTILSWLVVRWIGPEFPTIIAAIIAMLLTVFVFRKQYQNNQPIPKIETGAPLIFNTSNLIKAWSPYVLLIVILLVTRMDFFLLKGYLLKNTIYWNGIFGSSINASFAILYSPGTFFILTALLTLCMSKNKKRNTQIAMNKTCNKVLSIALVLLVAVPLVRIYIFSEVNNAGYPSMSETLANSFSNLPEYLLPFSSVFIGVLGTFLSGSATFSNMMFASVQYEMAVNSAIAPTQLLALQAIGANTGNMIGIVNIIAACAIVDIKDKEGIIIKYTILPVLLIAMLSVLSFIFLG